MIGYLDLPSGISGDMFLGCLVDGGWPIDELRDVVERLKLPSDEWSLDSQQVMKGPLRATQVLVKAVEGHHHRHLSTIVDIIEAADLAAPVKQRATAVFTRLAEAEAKVHGTTREKIHFHEVGALDAIIDIVGVVAGLHALDIEQLYASALPLGDGWANTAHGQLPLPAPATLELIAAADAPTKPAPGPGELVTPTGAALLAEMARFEQPVMQLSRIGIGAGQRDRDWPNVARLWLGQASNRGPLVQIETNIDDMNPQFYATVSERLFAAGARDVWLAPVQMKKGRPAVVLSVLGASEHETVLCDLILRETTTLGVRVHHVHRHTAVRQMRQVQTAHGPVNVKLKWVDHELIGATPEFDDCKTLADAAQVPVNQVYEAALAEAHKIAEGPASHDHDHHHDHT